MTTLGEARFAHVLPLPVPGDLLAAVQLEWDAVEVLGAPAPPELPRPWEPATCTAPNLLSELRTWLQDFVEWLNAEQAWNPDTFIPSCWPRHPHLVHEIAVLADQRRRASNDTGSTLLEQWQRTVLPAFHDRMRIAIGQHCSTEHQTYSVLPTGFVHEMASNNE